MKTNARILILSVLSSGFLTLVPTSHAQVANNLAPAYRVVDIGAIPGGSDNSSAMAVNNAGQVVGESGSPAAGFIWDAINGLTDLGNLGGFCNAHGLNNNGVVVGCSAMRPFHWDTTGGMQDLGSIGSYPYYGANAINDDGAIAYENWSYWGPPSTGYFLVGATATAIGELYPNSYTFPMGLNNNNEMVGACGLSVGPYPAFIWQAFLWKPGQSIVGLGFLPGYTNSGAAAINDAGQVVGNCNNGEGTHAAFLWTSGAGMTELGSSEIGGSDSAAYAISAGGITVGKCQIGGADHAIAWAPGQSAVDLTTLVTNLNGWVNITEACGINSSGVIVGSGLRTNGITHACILYPAAAPVKVNIKMFAGLIINNAPIGSNFLIQATSNLASGNWTTLTNVAIPTQPYIYIDYNSYTNSQQFYRAVPQ